MRFIASFASAVANSISVAAVAAAGVVAACALVGCGTDSSLASSTDAAPAALTAGQGGVVGQICVGHRFVSGAMVTAYRVDDLLERSAHADNAGTFSMDVPAGDYVGYAWAGDFGVDFSFRVRPGNVTEVPFGCDDVGVGGVLPSTERGLVYALDSAKSLDVK